MTTTLPTLPANEALAESLIQAIIKAHRNTSLAYRAVTSSDSPSDFEWIARRAEEGSRHLVALRSLIDVWESSTGSVLKAETIVAIGEGFAVTGLHRFQQDVEIYGLFG